MEWRQQFDQCKGSGWLATSGEGGEVDVAVYSKPRPLPDGTLAFGMTERLTHANLQANPKAVYALQGTGYDGVRLYLEKVREETAGPLLDEIRERADLVVGPGTGLQVKYAVYFRVTRALPLICVGEECSRL
jgi:hypothetical protein